MLLPTDDLPDHLTQDGDLTQLSDNQSYNRGGHHADQSVLHPDDQGLHPDDPGVLTADIRDKRDNIQSLPVDQGDLGQPPIDQGYLAADTRYNIEIKVSKKNESLEEEEDDFWMS